MLRQAPASGGVLQLRRPRGRAQLPHNLCCPVCVLPVHERAEHARRQGLEVDALWRLICSNRLDQLGRLPSPAGLSHVAQYHAEIIAVGALRCECERMPRHAPCSIQAHVHHHRQHACCRRVVWGWRRPLLLLVVATAPSGTGSWGGGWRTQRSQDVACPLCMSAACEAAQHVRHVAEIAIARHAQQQVDAGAVGAVRCQVGSHLVNERLIAEVILGEVVGRCHCRHRVCRCRPPPPPLWAEG
mmetsp:Transcript_38073/g.112768  ORF Transcript_38073/g.112768 Transcript_38073/m.112768 type:complete len:243 (+) Transcript_38073:443-1171(+)